MQTSYIEESKRLLRVCLNNHRGYVANNQLTKATGEPFNLPGYSQADLSVTTIERAKVNSTLYRKERGEYFIKLFNTYHRGINKKT